MNVSIGSFLYFFKPGKCWTHRVHLVSWNQFCADISMLMVVHMSMRLLITRNEA